MNTHAARLALVENTLATAFDGVVLGKGVSIRQSEVIDRYGEGCTKEEFNALWLSEVTDDWSRIPADELDRACVAHFDPEGFRYYIAPLALSVIHNYDGASLRVIGTIAALYPKEEHWYYSMQRYDILNSRQKHALALYLSHLPGLVPLEFQEPKQVERALRNYWHEFLSGPHGT
jgi:hypothetical protein